jgi:hypothetical protein
MNVHGIHDVRQTDVLAAEPLVPQPSDFEVDFATGNTKGYKSPRCADQILAELIVLRFTNLTLIIVIKQTVVIIEEHHCYQQYTQFYSVLFYQI